MTTMTTEVSVRDTWRQVEGSALTRTLAAVRHPSSMKLAKYASVSVISTICSQAVLFAAFPKFMTAVPANILANAVATVPSYALNRKWVWGKGGKSHFLKEVLPFWVLSFIGLAFSTLAVWGAQGMAHDHHASETMTKLVVNGANLSSFGILWIVKFVIYERLFQHNHGSQPVDVTDSLAAQVDAIVDSASVDAELVGA